MAKGYKKQEIISKCELAIKQIETFYQADFINYRGETIDTREFYSEVVSEFICHNIELFKNTIPSITRESSYKTTTHNGEYSENSNREEEITAMKIFNQSKNGHPYEFIGKILDYQIPLKSKESDVAGKIDLLSYDDKQKVLRILELKKKDSVETMLRCVIEGYTYLKTVNIEKLLHDFDLPNDTKVKASPFVFKYGVQYKEMLENRKQLKSLMTLLDSEPFYITEDNGLYVVGV